jgi:hypothetical protein
VTTSGKPRQAQLAVVPSLPDSLRHGLCATGGHPPDLWVSDRPADREQAVAICQRCPVLSSCRSWALSMRPVDDQVGVYGAMTTVEREAVRRERQRAMRAAAG